MKEKQAQAICGVCGREFLAYRRDARVCSDVCRQAKHHEYEVKSEQAKRHPCPDCGMEVARTSLRCRPCGNKLATAKRTGERNYAWKGGRSQDRYGYIHILVAPEARKGHRYRPEHILVWEKTHGKPLPKGWIVHHLNHIKDDNRFENLLAMPRATHNQRHGEQRILELETEVLRLRSQLDASRDSSTQIQARPEPEG